LRLTIETNALDAIGMFEIWKEAHHFLTRSQGGLNGCDHDQTSVGCESVEILSHW
jgi:hypothetical protein